MIPLIRLCLFILPTNQRVCPDLDGHCSTVVRVSEEAGVTVPVQTGREATARWMRGLTS